MRAFMKKFAVVLVLLFSAQLLLAGTTGKIVGTVKDQKTGEALIGADVVLEGTGLGSSTDQDGYFAIINVPPGTYRLTVFYVGYASTTVENVRISVDRTTTQHVTVLPATVEGQEVVVEANRAAIEIDRTHSAAIVSSETVDLMPVTEISEVIELQAGVVSSGGELHFRGGRAREVTYIVDGIPVSNAFSQSGGSNVTIETNMIEELEVISGTFNAEYGQAQSGVVNIVTKKPANKFSGNVQTYAGEWLSGHDEIYLGVSDFNPTAEKDIQFSLTGPIVRDKLGFFISGRVNDWESLNWYERRFNPIDGWRISAYQRWVQLYGSTAGAGVIYIPDSLTTGDGSMGPLRTGTSRSLNAKLIFTPHSKVSLTYQGFGSLDEYDGAPDNRFRRYQPDGAGTSRSWEYSQFLKFQHFPSEKFFYNLAFSWQHQDAERYFRKDNKVALYPGDDGIMPIAAASNGFSLGSTDGFYGDAEGKNYIDTYLANGDINWQIDKHNLIKAGFEVTKVFANVYGRGYRATPDWASEAYPPDASVLGANLSFDEFWNAMVNYWRTWEDSFQTTRFVAAADSEANLYRDFNVEPLAGAVYVQDKLEMGDIIVNAGMRLDYFQPNEVVPVRLRTESFNLGVSQNLADATAKWQLSPRLGISFPISSDGAFHASYGHFFQMPSYELMYNEPLVSLTRFQLEGRRLGNADLKAEKTIAYEIGLQQGITEDLSVDVTAYYKDFRNLLGIEQLITIDNVTYTRYINRDYGNTKGISVGFTKLGNRVNGGANYTIAFANGSSSSPDALNLINTAVQIGGEDVVFAERKVLPLDWDERHAANAYVNFVQPNNWSIGLVGYVNSGLPFDPQFVERFDLNEREFRASAHKPMRWSVDLKAKKNFKLMGLKSVLFFKIDNLFDHLNHEEVFATTGRGDEIAQLPDEKQLFEEQLAQEGLFTYDEVNLNPNNFSSPRKLQLGLEFKF